MPGPVGDPEFVIKRSGCLSLVKENGIISSLYRSVGKQSFLMVLTGLTSKRIILPTFQSGCP